MPRDDITQSEHHLWQSQEEEQMDVSMEQLRARARKYERENVWGFWVMLFLTPTVLAWAIYDLAHVHRPLLVATAGWLYLTFCYVAWRFLRKGPSRIGSSEPCVRFLKRQLHTKIASARAVRVWILLLLPAVVSAWWAGGPALRAAEFGIKSPWLTQLHGPIPLIVTIGILAGFWFLMGDVARKANREIEKLNEQ